MKKTLLLFAAVLFAVTACDKSTYVDGTYKVSYDAPDFGYTAYVEFTVLEDAVTSLDFDYINDAGDMLKSEDTAYAARMFPVSGTSPDLYMPLLEKQLMEAVIDPDFVEIDGVTGATGSTTAANYLFGIGLDAAVEGEPLTQTVPEPEED